MYLRGNTKAVERSGGGSKEPGVPSVVIDVNFLFFSL